MCDHWAKDYDPRGFTDFNRATLIRYMPIVGNLNDLNDAVVAYPEARVENRSTEEEANTWEADLIEA